MIEHVRVTLCNLDQAQRSQRIQAVTLLSVLGPLNNQEEPHPNHHCAAYTFPRGRRHSPNPRGGEK